MTIFINEYIRQGRDASGGVLPCGEEPALASYSVAAGANSPVLNDKTTFASIHADAATCIRFSTAGTAAVTTADRIAANATVFRAVQASSKLIIATIATT